MTSPNYLQPTFFESNIGYLRAVTLTSGLAFEKLIPHVISAETNEGVNQIGHFSFVIPAGDMDDSILVSGKPVRLYYGGEPLMTGRITTTVKGDSGEVPTVTINCSSLAIELLWQDTYYGIAGDNESAATVLTKILDDAENAWSQTVTGGAYVNITNEFAPGNSWNTILALAEMEDAYVREIGDRHLELSQNTVFGGVNFLNPPVAPLPVYAGFNAPQRLAAGPWDFQHYGIITSLRSLTNDGAAIANRLVPQGVASGDVILDLGLSNRASPYTINNLLGDTPRVTNTAVFVQNSYNQSQTTEFTLNISTSGFNRGIFAWEVLDIPASVVLPFKPTIDGREGIPLESLNTGGTGGYLATLYWWPNPRQGTNAIRLRYSSGGSADIKVFAVAVSGVLQNASPIRDTSQAFANASGGPATVAATSVAGDLGVGFLLWSASTATDDGGQTSIGNDTGGNAPAVQAAKKTAVGVSTSFSWTLGASQTWAVVAVALRPALIYYIEDAASIASFGRRTARFVMQANRFVGATATELQNAANTLYDRAVTRLERSKDGVFAYDLEISTHPDITPAWKVGDSVRVFYRGRDQDGTYVNIDVTVPVLERTRHISEDGILTWSFRVANVYRQPRSLVEILYDLDNKVHELETT